MSCVQIPPDLLLHSVEKELKISLLRSVDVCVLTQLEKNTAVVLTKAGH